MVHTVILNGRSYDLPKKNINVATKLDEVLKVDSIKGLSVRQKFEKLHVFSKDILGKENTNEILGTDNLEEIDLSELTIIVRKIVDAYEKPISDYQAERNREQLSRLPLQQLESITKVVDVASNMEKLNN
ncbi:MAG: hypothetical protein IKW30_03655 [Lachnospiraceae bacterium]|nr:hypothetical protein [Lachnospiraceae bacterium]